MRATVLVRPKAGILDPQGQAVESSLRHLGFAVDGTRVGRLVELEVATSDEGEARTQVERMCEQLLANPLIESYEIELHPRGMSAIATEPRPRIAIVVFPGSNDDRDADQALVRLGADAVRVWHTEPELPAGTAGVVLPAGSRTATTSAAARSRASRRSWPPSCGSPTRAASCSASATASRS